MTRSLWKFLTSLQLTVVCLAVSIVIVFFGTIAQVNEGLWAAQAHWFRSFFVWWSPAGATWKMPIFFGGYFVGTALLINLISAHIKRFQWGWRKLGIHLAHAGIVVLLLGGLMTDHFSRESLMSMREGQSRIYSESHLDNELAFVTAGTDGQEEVVSIPGDLVAHRKEITHPKLPFTVRVKEYQTNGELTSRASLNKTGGKLITALATVESEFATPESLPVQAERAEQSEGRVAVWRSALKAVGQPGKGDLVEIAKEIAKKPELAAKLNAELKKGFRGQMMKRFSLASSAMMRIPSTEAAAMHIAAAQIGRNQPATADAFPEVASNDSGREAIVVPLPEATDMDSRNMPYAVIELLEGAKSLGTWLVTPWLGEQEVKAGEKTYRMAFRFERFYQPFTVTLLKVTHEIYPGTATANNPEGIPKNYQSRVRITNPALSESREVDVYMNNPLRYGGLTFYQYQMGSDEAAGAQIATSTFQVVKNPSWLTPYLGCLLVAFGLIFQFGYHLIGFINKRLAPRPATGKEPVKKRRETRAPQTVP